MFEAAMEHFAQGLALLSEQDISAVPPRRLGADIQRIRGFINRAEAQCVRRVEVFDREQAYGSSGGSSTINWLRHHGPVAELPRLTENWVDLPVAVHVLAGGVAHDGAQGGRAEAVLQLLARCQGSDQPPRAA